MAYQREQIFRKLIHLFTGLTIWLLSYILEKDILLYLILAGTLFSFLTFNYRKFYLLHKTEDNSLGTLFYPLGILSAYLITWNLPSYYFLSSLLVLSISDTLANFSGHIQNGNRWIRMFHDKKSIYGIIVYTFSAYLILYLLLPDFLGLNILFVVFVLLWAIIFETASMRGSDNFTIPAGLALLFFLTYHYEVNYLLLVSIPIALAAGCFLLFQLNILTRKGSFVAFLLGFYLAGIGGWNWLLTVLLFFFSSAAFTKLHHAKQRVKDIPTVRNAWQVIANIIWAAISLAIFLFTLNEIFILFFIAFVSAVTADTWASEIGPLLNKRCISLSQMRMVPAGTNGGISFFGSLAALTGAIVVSTSSYYIFFGNWNWAVIAILSISAFMACFADSLLGTFFESKLLRMNYFKNQKTSESITPNDLVNIIGSGTASFFYILLICIFQ